MCKKITKIEMGNLKVCPLTGEHCNPEEIKARNDRTWDLIQKLARGEIKEIRAAGLVTEEAEGEAE